MAKTDPLDPLLLNGDTDPKLIDDKMQALARAVAEIINKDHYLGADGGAGVGYNEDAAGEHAQLTLRERTSPVSVDDDKGVVFVKVVDGVNELHYIDENEAEIQLTRGGLLLLDSSIISNDTPFQADNEAGDGVVDLIKAGRNEADDADVAMLTDETRLDSDAAATEDTQLVNKKMLDDQRKYYAGNGTPAPLLDGVFTYAGLESIAFPNGYIIKRGNKAATSNGEHSVSFDDAFPNELLTVQTTPVVSERDDGLNVALKNGTKAVGGFTVIVGSENYMVSFEWVAIGR